MAHLSTSSINLRRQAVQLVCAARDEGNPVMRLGKQTTVVQRVECHDFSDVIVCIMTYAVDPPVPYTD